MIDTADLPPTVCTDVLRVDGSPDAPYVLRALAARHLNLAAYAGLDDHWTETSRHCALTIAYLTAAARTEEASTT